MDPLARRRLGLTEVEVTQLGFGGAGLGDLFEVIPEAQAAATLEAAWDAGIRYYDTAPWYGLTQSEHRFGRALYRQPRRDFVLSTKFGRTMHAVHHAETYDRGIWTGGLSSVRGGQSSGRSTFTRMLKAAAVSTLNQDACQRLPNTAPPIVRRGDKP